jgi:protein TorT
MKFNVAKKISWAAFGTAVVLAVAGCGAAAQDAGAASGTQASSLENSESWTIPAMYTQRDGKTDTSGYEPLSRSDVSKTWKICVLFPHIRDALWTAANYGTLLEAKRAGAQYNAFGAGGYGNLATQVSQMDDCIAQEYDAIILGPISAEGNCAAIERALQAGIPVVDIVNGTACSKEVESNPLLAHAVVSYYDTATMVAEYMVKNSAGKDRQVGMFVGPEGAGFANDAARGFGESITGTNVKTVADIRGDTGLDQQLDLIEDSLRAYPEMTDIFGVDIAAEAGTIAVRNANKQDSVSVYGYAIIPGLYEAIVSGDASGAATDYTPYIGRIAVDTAIRLLEGKALKASKVGPVPDMVTPESYADIAYEDMFAPKEFQPTYNWAPQQGG